MGCGAWLFWEGLRVEWSSRGDDDDGRVRESRRSGSGFEGEGGGGRMDSL